MLADEVLARYREPLGVAALDLQSRLFQHPAALTFSACSEAVHARSEDATAHDIFRLAQYFGWTEILRRDIQFLSFPEVRG